MRPSARTRVLTGTALVLALSAVTTACGGDTGSSRAGSPGDAPAATPSVPVKDPLVATFDGGLYVLDGTSLKLAATDRAAGAAETAGSTPPRRQKP
ncbi:hypothetical protein [Streptomyces sp. NPDC058953]|uniref:hypothetical protein n=1 Tax=Streptomyces sp. NPDC058953 TaxID=3346676 RepID=UPI0036760C67